MVVRFNRACHFANTSPPAIESRTLFLETRSPLSILSVKSKNYSNSRFVDYFFILSSTLVITTGTSSDL